MDTINSLWISGELGSTQLLTIRSFQDQGHKFVLWSYIKPAKADCEIRDAREVLPEKEIFFYKHMGESFKFGGIAERLKSELLYQIGGWHVDMDVTCLQPLDFDAEYVLRPHPRGVVGNVIKSPAKSELARQYREWTMQINEENRDWELSFKGLCKAVVDLGLSKYVVEKEILGTDEWEYWRPFLKNNGQSPSPKQRIIHWCGAEQQGWEPGSFYHELLKRHNLTT